MENTNIRRPATDYSTRIANSLSDRYSIERELGQGGSCSIAVAIE
jgi:hypothetical protein